MGLLSEIKININELRILCADLQNTGTQEITLEDLLILIKNMREKG